MPRDNEFQFLNEVLLNNVDAVRFCCLIFAASQVIDDLIDQDKPVSPNEIAQCFWSVLVELPCNPFYQRHMHTLVPLIQSAFNDWLDANELERMDDHGKNIAFVLRDSVGGIACQVAYLVGGYDHMRKVSVAIRQHIFEETLTDYKEAFLS